MYQNKKFSYFIASLFAITAVVMLGATSPATAKSNGQTISYATINELQSEPFLDVGQVQHLNASAVNENTNCKNALVGEAVSGSFVVELDPTSASTGQGALKSEHTFFIPETANEHGISPVVKPGSNIYEDIETEPDEPGKKFVEENIYDLVETYGDTALTVTIPALNDTNENSAKDVTEPDDTSYKGELVSTIEVAPESVKNAKQSLVKNGSAKNDSHSFFSKTWNELKNSAKNKYNTFFSYFKSNKANIDIVDMSEADIISTLEQYDPKTLTSLTLVGNHNIIISESVFNKIESFKNLRNLSVTNCGLTQIPNSDSLSKSLKTLSLANNKIETLQGLRLGDHVTKLVLDGNNISNINGFAKYFGKVNLSAEKQQLFLPENTFREFYPKVPLQVGDVRFGDTVQDKTEFALKNGRWSKEKGGLLEKIGWSKKSPSVKYGGTISVFPFYNNFVEQLDDVTNREVMFSMRVGVGYVQTTEL